MSPSDLRKGQLRAKGADSDMLLEGSQEDSQSQTSSLTLECFDQVMNLPSAENADLKVLESINICYCSNFDLNINEWFNEYENIEIFKLNMKKNLGKAILFTY